jgi:copper(I)-binding protein
MKILLTASWLLLSTNLWAAAITIEDAYVRHMPPTQTVTGAFMVFKNASNSDRAVVSAQSNVADKIELHTHIHEGGVMRMRQVEKIDIPAGGEVILKPGGFHVMLIGLKQTLGLGQMVEIQFNFDDGSSEQIQAEVKSVMNGMKMQGGAMDHKKMDHSKMKTMQN